MILAPGRIEEAEEVAAADVFDVGVAVTALLEDNGELLEVGDGLNILRSLLGAETAVEIAADADVVGVACESGTIIQASIGAPKTPPRSMTARICSSLNWRLCGTSVRQFW